MAVLVENDNDLDINIIKNYQKIAVVSGASTPIEVVEKIADKLKSL